MKPFVSENAKQRVMDVLESGYLTEGPVTRELESRMKDYIGVKHAIAVCNCTVGLEVALRALGIGPGDEVIVPDYTYPATASSVAIVGATPVVVDVDPKSMLLDPEITAAAVTSRTKAIMPVSIFGSPLDYRWLDELKAKHGLSIIEDAACSIGAAVGEQKVGSFADISVFSMHPRKFITTGEGGMITTDNDEWAQWMDSYKHFGVSASPSREETLFARIGTNYKLSNLQSALGVAQMDDVDMLLSRRRELAQSYMSMLSDNPSIKLPGVTDAAQHSFQSFCVFLPFRNEVMKSMRALGIEVQIGTYALHQQSAYQDSAVCRLAGPFPGSCEAFDTCLTLPLYHDMTEVDQQDVVTNLNRELASRCGGLRKIA